MGKRIIVAGAGHGGLAAAAQLAKAGFEVTVYERFTKDKLGYDWFDAVNPAVFHMIGCPHPEEAGIPWQWRADVTYFGPNTTDAHKVPQQFKDQSEIEIVMERRDIYKLLCGYAEDCGAKIEYGYVSEGCGSFSYGEADLPDGVIAKIIGNFAVDGRERAGRDMAVFYVQKHKLDDRDINGVELYAEFTTVDDEMQIKELGYAKLESNAFWNDRIHARIFTHSVGGRFSLGYFSHKQNRFWDKPDTVRLTIFTFDGERISVAFDETVNVDISSVTDRLPTAQDFPELAPYVDALESLGYGATANAWREDISSIDMAQSDVTPHLLIGTFPATNGLYEKLLATPAGETVEGNTVRGFIQPGM